jgi:hypothetical protein
MGFGTWKVGILYTAGKNCKIFELDLMGVQEVKLDRGGTEQHTHLHFTIERGMRITN